MKKTATFFLIGAFLLFAYLPTKAQSFKSGDNIFNLGVGVVGGDLYAGGGYSTSVPPISLSYEHGMNIHNFGLGAIIAFSSSAYNYNYYGYSFSYHYSYKIIGLRAAYHFYTQEHFDIYGGLILGYDIVSATSSDYTGNGYNYTVAGSSLAFDIFVGARYYFSDHVGAMAELGYGISILNIGLAFKL
ncbi:MAG TPA: hypothetical protein VNE41_08505 [Chitinophagaceae bacterium]|nr:hypothetical protein [Chitinophagaceae bacterium]